MKTIALYLYQKKYYLFFIFIFLVSAHIYSQYFSNFDYPDEFDNFAYTWLILKGLVVYKDFFSNHLPTLMILGIPAELVQHSQLSYRVEVFFIYFSFFFISFNYLAKYLKFSIILFILFSSYGIALYGGQQFADGTIWALTLIAAFFIVAKNLGKPLSKRETIIFSLLMLATVLSSLMHILGFILLIIFHLVSQKNRRDFIKKNLVNLKIFLITLAIPCTFLFLYLIATKSLISFYNAAIAYNSNYYYYHLYPNPYIKFHFIDYYLHTSRDVFNHLYEIFQKQGPYLLDFAKSLKTIVFHPALIIDSTYNKAIFSEFYQNFFTFEVLIIIFYFFGFIALLKKNKALAFFSLLFIFALRVRINERIHMAPYYLFSYWMVAVAITITLEQIQKRKNTILNLLFLVVIISTLTIFLAKNNYDFRQVAYNKHTLGNEKTTTMLKQIDNNEKIFVIAHNMASYYWVSGHLPFGYFINYYEFFEQSPALKEARQNDLKNYHGNYLIVGNNYWTDYLKNKGGWLDESLGFIYYNFKTQGYPEIKDFVFKRNPFYLN